MWRVSAGTSAYRTGSSMGCGLWVDSDRPRVLCVVTALKPSAGLRRMINTLAAERRTARMAQRGDGVD